MTRALPGSFNAELDAETQDGTVRANHPSVTNESRAGEDREERRRTLKDPHDKGLVSDEEYDTKRKEILGEL